ncbi:MAG: DUF86 domain-containing protein [Patescibacteria group bacterium]|jgi:uncharacterized protein with HEPN domain
MGKRKISPYINDIIESAERILEYGESKSYEEFEVDQKTVDAVERCFEIIGEASKNIPMEIKDKYEDIPWVEIIGMRNMISHEYFQVSLKTVWKTIKEDIPELIELMKKMLKDFENL